MYYQKHLFLCTNQRDDNKQCCNNVGATEACHYAKQRIADLGLKGKGHVRVSSAGCMGRCSEGPVLVVYPDAVWYTYHSLADIDQIIDEHIVHGRKVERLLLSELHFS